MNAEWDWDVLTRELKKLDELDFDLETIGFNEQEMMSLIDVEAVVDEKGEWDAAGMPEYDQPDLMPFRTIFVHFTSQEDFDAFAKLIAQTFTDKSKFCWFPEQERAVAKDKRWTGSEDEASAQDEP